VVSSLVGSNRGHFWHTFDEALRAQSPLRQPETASALIQETVDSNINEYSNSIETQSQAINALFTPTYARGGAKDIALSDSIAPKAASHGEHGTEWGSLLHNLFESAMKHPDHDIRPLAIAQLNELGLPQSRLDEALDTVTTVMQSDIWKRAQANDHVLTEVPFQYAQTTTDDSGKQTPIIRRGIIDLSFKEQDGWVIVDYKTDQSAMENLDQMIEYYTPQLKAYAEAWEQCTGEFVKESGLYFSTVNRYLRTIE
jgi:ATP-dependent helicase/nuclease subunit A